MDALDLIRRLELFRIPSDATSSVRVLLARLLAAQTISLGELQTARDIVHRAELRTNHISPCAYLFLAALFISQHAGNTYLVASEGPALLQKNGYLDSPESILGSNADYAQSLAALWPQALQAAQALDGDVLISCGDKWFFKRNYNAVKAISSYLFEREKSAADESSDTPPTEDEINSIRKIDAVHELNVDQLAAVRTVLSRHFAVITGGPGTGKTTIVCAFLRLLISRGLTADDIALIAPTGRAAQRMGEALHKQAARASLEPHMRGKIDALEGTTIHSLLGGRAPHWKYTAANKLALKLVVVDESSMVDVHLMKALLDALPSTCRLVLLGDKDQLPSVEAGAVLGDIVRDHASKQVVYLRTSNRFTGAFAQAAAAINEGNAEKFAALSPDLTNEKEPFAILSNSSSINQCFRLTPSTNLDETCQAWAAHNGLLATGQLVRLASDPNFKDDASLTNGTASKLSNALFAALESSRILTVVRQGPSGAAALNTALLRARFNGRLPRVPLSACGIPVLITRNNPTRGLWNGECGVTVQGPMGLTAIFPRGDKVVSCPVGLLPEHELGYALTVHKAQGSEFENVLVVLPPETNPLLSRALVYTALTRGKKRAFILGNSAALEKAIQTPLTRHCGI